MQDAKKHLKWCLKQNKGIKITKPSENLTTAYLRKSRNALKSMEINAESSITEWAVSASYYAKYFAVYALLAKIGAKSEIHDCTIALFDYLFSDSVPEEIIKALKHSKEDRIELQETKKLENSKHKFCKTKNENNHSTRPATCNERIQPSSQTLLKNERAGSLLTFFQTNSMLKNRPAIIFGA